ncbi:MAG: peptidase [Thaumarchaeota archaeon]|nr:peptidase [Nitrososphaerota archaeon]
MSYSTTLSCTSTQIRKLYKIPIILLVLSIMIIPPISLPDAKAYSDHPNLFVSAENSLFNNYFSGPMVVEVIVREDNTQLDQALGEPNVSVNGKNLRMVQGTDGNWYAFFANTDKAQQADQAAFSGSPGQSIDFGVFCSGTTPLSVLGIDVSNTDGVAIPDSSGLSGTTQGTAGFNSCSGTPGTPSNQNNVVRNPPSLNTNPKVPVGQVGINPNVWPLIQLFTFTNDVHIEYNRSTGTQSVDLTYSDIPNISLSVDRTGYPSGSDVFATINDIELNIDPTSLDSWTFNIGAPQATFYQAFAESGKSASGSGLVNLMPYLSSMGFKDNGKMSMTTSDVVNLKTNSVQTSSSLTGGYNKLVTFVETGPNTGIFESSFAGASTIGTLPNAPRDHTGSITYNLQSVSIVSGTTTAGLTVGTGQTPSNTNPSQFGPGQSQTITLIDNTQNLNSNLIEQLDDFRSSAKIPTLKIGNPITLSSSSNVKFYNSSSSISVPSTVFDSNSLRLIIDTRSQSISNFQKITMNLGVNTQSLKDLLIDTNKTNSKGTNWINYDLRSFQQQLGITSFSSTSMTLYFGAIGSSPVQIMTHGTIVSGNGLVQISDASVTSIESMTSNLPVYLEINFNTSGNVSNPSNTQPIVFDLFSFGNNGNQIVNNAIYRAELQETSANSGVFSGTMEYSVINQLNQYDPNLIKSLRTFGSNIKFLVSTDLVDANAIHFSVLGVQGGTATPVTSQHNLPTHAGIVTLDSANYRIGSDVFITVTDPDLIIDSNTIDSYSAVNDPNSSADDTVGDSSGNILLEVWIKGYRFQHCTVNGVTYGGLGATGFTLTETGPGTGVFQGVFKIPSWICSEDGTSIVSPVGGNVKAWYHDFRDQNGASTIIGSTVAVPAKTPPATSTNQYTQQITMPMISKTTQISDQSGRPLLQNPHVGQAVNFQSMISNKYNQNYQKFSYIVQIKDSNNKVVFLKWTDSNLVNLSTTNEEIHWIPTSPGVYSAEIYVWDGMDTLVPLIDNTQYKIQVSP